MVSAADGRTALERLRSTRPDMLILDLGLPDIDGLDITREVRRISSAPILMLTARSDETDKIVGLELGADDYITKPFSPKELVARVRAVFRRMEAAAAQASGAAGEELIHAADLTLDVPRLRISAVGRSIPELTPSEFTLLATLARSPGRVFTRSQLLDALHGVAFESYERAIDAHIKNLRHKVERDPAQPAYILTVYGVGYKFNDRLESHQ